MTVEFHLVEQFIFASFAGLAEIVDSLYGVKLEIKKVPDVWETSRGLYIQKDGVCWLCKKYPLIKSKLPKDILKFCNIE